MSVAVNILVFIFIALICAALVIGYCLLVMASRDKEEEDHEQEEYLKSHQNHK